MLYKWNLYKLLNLRLKINKKINKSVLIYKEKMTKKRYFINFAIILILATISGFYAGNYYNRNFGRNVAQVTVSEDYVRGDDLTKALKKSSGKTPMDLSAIENFVLADHYLSKQTSVHKHVTGAITAVGVKQSLVSDKIIHNGEVYASKISVSSFVKVAEVYRHKINEGNVEVYLGDPVSATEAKFPKTPSSTMTVEDYTSKFGVTPQRLISLVVGSKTVVDASTVTKNEKGNYTATLQLDTTYSVMNYVNEIKQTAGSSKLPYFKSVKIVYEIDANWKLLSLTSYENYEVSVAVLGFQECSGEIFETYTYDNVEIPSK